MSEELNRIQHPQSDPGTAGLRERALPLQEPAKRNHPDSLAGVGRERFHPFVKAGKRKVTAITCRPRKHSWSGCIRSFARFHAALHLRPIGTPAGTVNGVRARVEPGLVFLELVKLRHRLALGCYRLICAGNQ